MAEHEGTLQLLALRYRDVLGRQRAEPGRDAVVRPLLAGELIDDGAGGGHRVERSGVELDPLAEPRDRDDVLEGGAPVPSVTVMVSSERRCRTRIHTSRR